MHTEQQLRARIEELEEALQHSQQQLLKIVESLGDAAHVIDSELRCIVANRALKKWNKNLGLETRLTGRSVFEIHPFLAAEVRSEYQRVLKTGKSHTTERRAVIGDREFLFEERKIPLSSNGSADRILTILRDITPLRRAEKALEEKTLQQEQLIKTARHLTDSPDVTKVLAQIGMGAREIAKAQACAIYLLEKDGQRLTPIVTNDPLYGEEILATPLMVDASFTGQAVKAKKGLVFNDAWANADGYQIPGTPVEENERVLVAPFIVDGLVLGAMCLNRSGTPFTDQDLALAKAFAAYAASALKSARTYHQLQLEVGERKRAEAELQQSFAKLQRLLEETVNVLLSAVEIRDPYTAGHQRRVTVLACAIAEEMGLPQNQLDGIRMAALIHDIGKIYVPAEILNRPGQLTDTELNLIKIHPQAGHDVLKMIEFPWPVARTVLQHHERLNGSGFPKGISGDDILLEARVLGVADVVEAMSSHRPYRPAHALKEALEEIEQNKGVLYDPRAVEACVRLFQEKGFEFE